MTQRRFGIGATVAAVTLAAAFVAAQGTAGSTATQGRSGDEQVVTGQAPPAQGQMRPGRGMEPGRGNGQGPGAGQQLGPGAGRGGEMQRGRRGGGPAGPGARRGGGLAALDLTDEQRVAITGLQRATRDESAPLQDELTYTRQTLRRALFADERDDAVVANLSTKVSALEKQLADLHVKQAMAMADVLTPQQRETMRLADGRGPGRFAGRGPGRR